MSSIWFRFHSVAFYGLIFIAERPMLSTISNGSNMSEHVLPHSPIRCFYIRRFFQASSKPSQEMQSSDLKWWLASNDPFKKGRPPGRCKRFPIFLLMLLWEMDPLFFCGGNTFMWEENMWKCTISSYAVKLWKPQRRKRDQKQRKKLANWVEV